MARTESQRRDTHQHHKIERADNRGRTIVGKGETKKKLNTAMFSVGDLLLENKHILNCPAPGFGCQLRLHGLSAGTQAGARANKHVESMAKTTTVSPSATTTNSVLARETDSECDKITYTWTGMSCTEKQITSSQMATSLGAMFARFQAHHQAHSRQPTPQRRGRVQRGAGEVDGATGKLKQEKSQAGNDLLACWGYRTYRATCSQPSLHTNTPRC